MPLFTIHFAYRFVHISICNAMGERKARKTVKEISPKSEKRKRKDGNENIKTAMKFKEHPPVESSNILDDVPNIRFIDLIAANHLNVPSRITGTTHTHTRHYTCRNERNSGLLLKSNHQQWKTTYQKMSVSKIKRKSVCVCV